MSSARHAVIHLHTPSCAVRKAMMRSATSDGVALPAAAAAQAQRQSAGLQPRPRPLCRPTLAAAPAPPCRPSPATPQAPRHPVTRRDTSSPACVTPPTLVRSTCSQGGCWLPPPTHKHLQGRRHDSPARWAAHRVRCRRPLTAGGWCPLRLAACSRQMGWGAVSRWRGQQRAGRRGCVPLREGAAVAAAPQRPAAGAARRVR
jgi:hypothetical protein